MRMAEVHSDIEQFMQTREYEVEHTVNNLVNAAKDVADLRLNNEARGILLSEPCRVRIALALDALQITYDDLEGKR